MKRFALVLCLALCAASPAAAEIYHMSALPLTVRENVAGGKGNLLVKYAFVRKDAPAENSIKEMGYMVLLPGDSIGVHQHDGTEDCYLIASGRGVFTDDDKTYDVSAGDMTVCRSGHKHGLANTGDVPLTFFAVLGSKGDTRK
ncbi:MULTISPECIES: cupin domain-containing protein [Jonquetella]|uniref:Cupin domain-containing protein n=1 Tax=Jonquetella anthropi DSM 22815 TaxID=885272 RepID=H0UL66_9BACT|nr:MULTISPECIES: cupin domain-containing protein [Jonquetella]EEX47988.1 cupin domain protein [Jonquetella anthropi E3_33 E1]EHM13425.1 cupin domain-containing protein [Jonquetella anthropi DSM 22815]ERL24309.1 cupin domain protein [Jonquetella sp. BV3C21]